MTIEKTNTHPCGYHKKTGKVRSREKAMLPVDKRHLMTFGIFLLSVTLSLILPVNELFKGIAATPALIALILALFNIARDESAHHKKIDLQLSEQRFIIGATSPMATLAFEKHVDFCEDYMREIHATIRTLFREGPTKLGIDHSNNLAQIRERFSAWVTQEIAESLEPFETALRRIGAGEIYITNTAGSHASDAKRQRMIEEVYNYFGDVMGIGTGNRDINETIAAETIKEYIRTIIGVSELSQLRKSLLKKALSVSK